MRAIVWLLSAALAGAPTTEAPVMLPTPYTIEQMREGWVPGVALTFEMKAAGKPTTLHRWEVVSKPDADQVETAFTVLAEDGETVIAPRTVRGSALEALRKHAEFPADRATVEPATLTTPFGTFPGKRFTVTDPENPSQVQVFEFADALPGPPVRMATTEDGVEVQSMVMTARSGP